jgi:hypothetical protein
MQLRVTRAEREFKEKLNRKSMVATILSEKLLG